MHVATPVERNRLALQIRHAVYRRIVPYQHGLGLRARHGCSNVGERSIRCLREDGWRFTHVAEIDGTDIQRFQLHRPGIELGPGDRHLERREPFLERSTSLEQRQIALLVTNAQGAFIPGSERA